MTFTQLALYLLHTYTQNLAYPMMQDIGGTQILQLHAISLNQLPTFNPCRPVEDNLGPACMTQPLLEDLEVKVAGQTLG